MDDKVLELLTKMYSEINGRFDKIENDISEVKSDILEVKSDISEVKNEVLKTNIKIENNIMPKINVLFDGYKQNSEQLSRIETEVIKHEEVILRRIK